MKKRIAVILMCLLLTVGAARAEEVVPTDEFFARGKQALAMMACGEIDQALQTLNFVFDVESVQTEDTFRRFASEAFTLLESGLVQVEVALCWQDETGVWHLGIPLVEPVSWDVEALVLDSRDLIHFSGYSASNWGTLEEAAALSEKAYWNVEYVPGETVLFADE